MSTAIERWNAFLSKIQERAQTYFDAARTESLPLFKKHNGDPYPVGAALHAIHLQLQELREKVEETWTTQVEPLMQKELISSEKIHACYHQGLQLQHTIRTEFQLLEAEINHQMALYILERAQADHVTTINCTQCSAPLEIPDHVYQSEHIICRFCQTINTYEPGTFKRLVGSFSIEHLARWHVIDELKDTWALEGQLDLQRDEAYNEGKMRYKDAFRTSTLAYLKELKKYRPGLDVDKELEIAMRIF